MDDKDIKKDILILAFPYEKSDELNKEHFGRLQKDLSKNDNVKKVFMLGNGEKPLNVNDINKNLKMLYKREESPTIMVYGDMHTFNNFELGNGKKDRCKVSELFEVIGKNFPDKPVDVFIACSHGESAVHNRAVLPEGSTVASITDIYQKAFSQDVAGFNNNLRNLQGAFTADNLSYFYMGKSDGKTTPVISSSGQSRIWNASNNLKKQIEKPLSTQECKMISKKLNGVLSPEVVKSTINDCRNVKDPESIKGGYASAVFLARVFNRKPDKEAENNKNEKQKPKGISERQEAAINVWADCYDQGRIANNLLKDIKQKDNEVLLNHEQHLIDMLPILNKELNKSSQTDEMKGLSPIDREALANHYKHLEDLQKTEGKMPKPSRPNPDKPSKPAKSSKSRSGKDKDTR